jgi:PhzF family phenazine biosynthesis protein
MTHRISWLDVFAERPLAGNGLAVVDDADGVSDETMLALAQEMGLSETTFVQSTEAEGADYRNRIWDPHEELPFAGHPSLGTAVAVARWRGLDEAGFVQETGAGLQPIEVRRENGSWRASMLQNEAEFGTELDRDAVMTAARSSSTSPGSIRMARRSGRGPSPAPLRWVRTRRPGLRPALSARTCTSAWAPNDSRFARGRR